MAPRRAGGYHVTPQHEPSLNAAAIVEVFVRHGVHFVVIGAFAAIAQQAPIPATRDINMTPESTSDNLNRLSEALKELHTKIRTDAVEGGLPFDHNGKSLGQAEILVLDLSFRRIRYFLSPERIREWLRRPDRSLPHSGGRRS